MCFAVFCSGYFRYKIVFCDVLRVFCECFAVFLHNTQNTRTTSPNTGKHIKKSQHAHVLRAFSKSQKSRLYLCNIAQNTFPKTSAKHRKTQNTATHSQNSHKKRVLQNYSQNTAIHTRCKTLKITKRSQCSRNTCIVYCAHSVFSRRVRVNPRGPLTFDL